MNKKIARVLTDLLMFVSMCFLTGTGLLIHYRLIPGHQGGRGLTSLSLSRHEWGTFHLWAAYLLLLLVLVHLVLNFTFIWNVIARKKPWLLILLSLSGLFIIIFFLITPIKRGEIDGKGHGRRFHTRETTLKERL